MANSLVERLFKLQSRQTTVRREMIAGLTTFLAMVYSIIVVPGMLKSAGFPSDAVFIATCLIAGIGSILMGLWANLPMAIGCAISLAAFTAYSLGIGQTITIPEALGAIFFMGVIFSLITLTGLRAWILRNIPMGIAHGTGIGIGLFLLIIAVTNSQVGIIVKNTTSDIPVALGHFTSFPVLCALIGLAAIIGLEKRKIPGSILLVIIVISVLGLIFDPNVKYQGLIAIPSLSGGLFMHLDFAAITKLTLLPTILALVMTAVFDATGTIRAVAGQADLIDDQRPNH